MDEQKDTTTYLTEAFSVVLTAIGEAMTKVALAFGEALTIAFKEVENAHYYQQTTGQPYDASKIVDGSLTTDVLLLPSRAQSRIARNPDGDV